MEINKNIAISDSGFVFNPSTGDSFSTNQIGVEIINLLKEGKDISEVVNEVTSKYNVEKSNLEKDLGDFFSMLTSFQIIK